MTARFFDKIAKVRQPSKRILIIDDDPDTTLIFKGGYRKQQWARWQHKRSITYHNSICIIIDESNISLVIMEKRSREFRI
ncbi:MAG: hypothetical protein DLM72_10775 [Candidatus Nitrosopolaris wilkensis]|nr:MAG: hypothetical protein DLM72_10775 [Candidatus Nitrosopolaris wilkensis]